MSRKAEKAKAVDDVDDGQANISESVLAKKPQRKRAKKSKALESDEEAEVDGPKVEEKSSNVEDLALDGAEDVSEQAQKKGIVKSKVYCMQFAHSGFALIVLIKAIIDSDSEAEDHATGPSTSSHQTASKGKPKSKSSRTKKPDTSSAKVNDENKPPESASAVKKQEDEDGGEVGSV
jgi:hypothetical protein